MKGEILDKGQYEILESQRGRIMISFNGANTYIWSTENNIETLRLTNGISYKSGDGHFKVARSGPYFIINTIDETYYKGLPHLYLKHENHYDEYILQDGLPNLIDIDKEIIPTNRVISAEEIENFTYQRI